MYNIDNNAAHSLLGCVGMGLGAVRLTISSIFFNPETRQDVKWGWCVLPVVKAWEQRKHSDTCLNTLRCSPQTRHSPPLLRPLVHFVRPRHTGPTVVSPAWGLLSASWCLRWSQRYRRWQTSWHPEEMLHLTDVRIPEQQAHLRGHGWLRQFVVDPGKHQLDLLVCRNDQRR